VVVFTVGAKGWMIERKLRRQTAAWASIERSRSRILEDINGSTPLSKIMEHIKSMVSSRLDGAPCWFEIADGPQWGTRPGNSPSLRLTREPIPARQGPPIGIVSAAFDPFSIPRPIESEVLTMAAELATLAIETRRLYSDLRHRSEFDLLTDIHNRFSLEKCLEEEIERATRTAAIFGLIYIDLDRFKEINDRYGHHIGDRYLQTVTTRMNCQLRSVDILARLGGDEFVALIPMAHTRAHVEEIARRLENCFIEPFALESRIVYTSASFGIALYPTDGTTKDSLLKAADTAMYIVKNAKRQSEPAPADSCPVPG
jgi:diguanylate cyclase (GGDEF)-like protein